MAEVNLRFAVLSGIVTGIGAALTFLSFDHPWALRGDNKLVLFPMTLDAYRQWMEGHIPVWSSGLWAGYPLLADCTTGAFYILHLLPFLVTPDPHLRAFDLSTALHAGILVTGTVLLLGQLGFARLTAVFAALLTLMAPHVLAWTHFQPPFCALSWWPWVMLFAQRLSVANRFSPLESTAGSAALALQVFAGYPEFALNSGCFAAAWLLSNRTGVSLVRRFYRVLLLTLGALLLAAPQLVPTALEVPDTIRAAGAVSLPGFPLEDWAAIFDPRLAGSLWPAASPFLGIATLLLAISALLLRAPRSIFLFCAAMISGLLALGNHTPLYQLLFMVPPFSLFRIPHKYFLICQLSIIWLAAGGLHQLFASISQHRLRLGLVAFLTLCALTEYGVQFAAQFPRAALPRRQSETILPEGLAPLQQSIDLLTGSEGGVGPPPRVHIASHPTDFGSLGLVYGVESDRGGGVALLSKRHQYLYRVRLSKEHLDLLGVQLVFAPKGCRPLVGFELLWRESDACVLRNPDWPMRYTFLSRVRPVGTVDEMLTLVAEDPAGAGTRSRVGGRS